MDSRENLTDAVSEAVAFLQCCRHAGDALTMIEPNSNDGSLLSLEKAPLLSAEGVAHRLICPLRLGLGPFQQKASYFEIRLPSRTSLAEKAPGWHRRIGGSRSRSAADSQPACGDCYFQASAALPDCHCAHRTALESRIDLSGIARRRQSLAAARFRHGSKPTPPLSPGQRH
jgi:hypothetical protein